MHFEYKNLKLEVPKPVYFPREDSLLMADVLEQEELANKKVLDVGCGSGLLSLVAAAKGAAVTAVDISQDAVECTQQNAEQNRLPMEVHLSDVFRNVKGRFDLIVSNPPYLPLEEKETPNLIYSAGEFGTRIIEKILVGFPKYILPHGKLLLLHSSLTDMRSLLDIVDFEHYAIHRIASQKLDFEELIVLEITFLENY